MSQEVGGTPEVGRTMSKGKNERIEELEKQVKSILWCIDWDFKRITSLTDQVNVLEADLKVRKDAEEFGRQFLRTKIRLMAEALSARAEGDSFSGRTADSKPASGGSIPSSPANAFDLPTGHTAWGSSSTAQFNSTPIQCADPCQGSIILSKPLDPPTDSWEYRPGCCCALCESFRGTQAWWI